MDTSQKKVLIVGASMGGLRAAEQLRSAGWDGDIEIIGDETHLPYNRPPLSKEILTDAAMDTTAALGKLAFRLKRSMADVSITTGNGAVAADLAAGTVTLADGSEKAYDGLVVATGIRPRRLDIPEAAGGRHVVRTIEDSLALRAKLVPGARVAVIGAGFIGCEVAATAIQNGCSVTLIEGGKGPMHRPLGATVAAAFRKRLQDRGIICLEGAHAAGFEAATDEGQQVAAVLLEDGRRIEADVVIEAVGSIPNTEWLAGNGLDLTDGVLTDQHLRVIGADNVVAVGDIARYPDPRWATGARRVEHWATPGDTAKTAARSLIAHLTGGEAPEPCRALPNFWSDQFGLRITGMGAPAMAENHRVLEGDLADIDAGVSVGYYAGQRLVGFLSAGLSAKRVLELRAELEAAPVLA